MSNQVIVSTGPREVVYLAIERMRVEKERERLAWQFCDLFAEQNHLSVFNSPWKFMTDHELIAADILLAEAAERDAKKWFFKNADLQAYKSCRDLVRAHYGADWFPINDIRNNKYCGGL